MVSLQDIRVLEDIVVEEGDDYRQNAILKAKVAALATGLVALGEDSGLEVEALGGAPGPTSARFLGAQATYEERFTYILGQLQGLPTPKRAALFRCVMALVDPVSGRQWVVEDTCPGYIAFSPRGEGGFGYDPIFYIPTRTATMAQLPPQEKNRISHRAKAAWRLRQVLKELRYELENR